MPESHELLPVLRAAGLIGRGEPAMRPLAGGISSDILLVEEAGRRFVVKRALAKLRVRDEWFADVSRNHAEQAWFAYAARIVPSAVPKLLHVDRPGAWFAMEFLGAEWRNWKAELLAGRTDADTARLAGDLLARLHAASWNEPAARAGFDTGKNFHDLRVAPYLLATADRVPAAGTALRAEAARLGATRLALVHGDYSPKNLLMAPGRLMILDAEVAWFGDPAFDIAFLLSHLFLKAIHHAPVSGAFLSLADEAWGAYRTALGARFDSALEARVTRLVVCLLLARVHGKSPVEYLGDRHRAQVAAFALAHLPAPPASFASLRHAWHMNLLT